MTNKLHKNLQTLDQQIESGTGRPYRMSGVSIKYNTPAKWVKGQQMHYTVYTFKYLDKLQGKFEIEIDPYFKIIRKTIYKIDGSIIKNTILK